MTKQEIMKQARTKGRYDQIWQNTGKCVFCDLKDKYILLEENGIVLTTNIYPYIDGQLMAIPRKHISSPKDLTELEWATIRKFTYIAKKMIRKVHGHKGMWTLIREGGVNAQMSVNKHLHAQFIPFDQPNLCEWSYRELQYTPLENTKLYRQEYQEIIKKLAKFEKKYQASSSIPVICDLLIINQNQEILFQKRKDQHSIKEAYFTLPGGHVDNFNKTLIEELQREIKEEINYSIKPQDVGLLDSRLETLNFQLPLNSQTQSRYQEKRFLWNTYLLKNFDESQKIQAQDDCAEIIWLKLDTIDQHPEISKNVKKLISTINL